MKKLGIIALVLVLALGAMGVGYAHWQQTLYIEGTVNTGSYCVGFLNASTTDPCVSLCPVCDPGDIGPNPESGTVDPGYDKNVGCAEAMVSVEKDCCTENKTAYEQLDIVICNAYPSYTANVTFSLKNCGTVPGNVLALTITEIGGSANITPIVLTSGVMQLVDLDGEGTNDMEITYVPPEDPQVDPCNEKTGYNLLMHFINGGTEEEPQGLPQNATLSFSMELETVQWNFAP